MRLFTVLMLGLVMLLGANAYATMAASPFDEKALNNIDPKENGIITSKSDDQISRLDALVAGANFLTQLAADITDDNAGNGTDGIDETPDDPDDGGWNWILNIDTDPHFHSTANSSLNLYGATAQGLLRAYIETGEAKYFTALNDAAGYMAGNTGIRSAADLIFLINFNNLPEVTGTTYQDAAKAKFDGRIADNGTATGLAEYIRDVRHGQGYDNGIIPWDIGAWAVAAMMLDPLYPPGSYDYGQAGIDIAEVLYQDSFQANPGYFDIAACQAAEPGTARAYWFNLGLTGLIDAFSSTGTHTAEIPDLVDLLLDSQVSSGAVTYYANGISESFQTTAYAGLCLVRLNQTFYQAEINKMAHYLASVQHDSGAIVYSNGDYYPEICGEAWAALSFSSPAVVGPDVAGYPCLSVTSVCLEDIPVDITSSGTTAIRGFDITFSLVDLLLCDVPNVSITQGTYLTGNTQYYVVDHLNGSYTVSCVILGATSGATGNGTLFNIDVQRDGVDGTGIIQIDSVILRDLENGPLLSELGPDAELTIDTEPPVAIANIASAQVLTGNDTDGKTDVTVTFSMPPTANTIEIYRAPYGAGDVAGAYPEFDDVASAAIPAVPTYPPGAPWTLTTLTGSSQQDAPANRGYWYYVAYTWDECGNISLISNISDGSLNYHLGDTAPTGNPGDNDVATADVTVLSAAWGSAEGDGNYDNTCDYGPTADMSTNTMPDTDNLVNFEDLMIISMNFSLVSFTGGVFADNANDINSASLTPSLRLLVNEVSLNEGDLIHAHLQLSDNTRLVKGLHGVIAYDDSQLEYIGVTMGDLLNGQSGNIFFKDMVATDGIYVDAAALGANTVIDGAGEVAVISFRLKVAGALPTLVTADLRDTTNHRAVVTNDTDLNDRGSSDVNDTEFAGFDLIGAQPNPFRNSTGIHFRLSDEESISLNIYDASGRLVRTLVNQEMTAGSHSIQWDGRHNAGHLVGPGLYLYTLKTNTESRSDKIFLVR